MSHKILRPFVDKFIYFICEPSMDQVDPICVTWEYIYLSITNQLKYLYSQVTQIWSTWSILGSQIK